MCVLEGFCRLVVSVDVQDGVSCESFSFKHCGMEHWSLIQNQPLLKTIFEKPPIISYKKGKSLKDTLVRAKI